MFLPRTGYMLPQAGLRDRSDFATTPFRKQCNYSEKESVIEQHPRELPMCIGLQITGTARVTDYCGLCFNVAYNCSGLHCSAIPLQLYCVWL